MSKISELKNMSIKEMYSLSNELRAKIIDTVSKNGGHLASNLGMVEATIALHRVFDSPHDKIIFDVGHQAYAHKLLTGRDDSFDTLRKSDGISGFVNRFESEHDILTEGHSGTSISSALGIAEANRLKGSQNYTIAVLGDGSLTNGLVYEALNNCAEKPLKLIILINDNEMSISQNVGGMHRYFTKIRVSRKYFKLKRGASKSLSKIPLIGKALAKLFRKIKNLFKRIFVKENLFEELGLDYIGLIDGNDIGKLISVLNEAKKRKGPCVVHMVTKKGKGYSFAEEEPQKYHGTGKFDKKEGVLPSYNETFSSHVGKYLTKKAEEDDKVCAITAAMAEGTGLSFFEKAHPQRFFDVGIAEEHALTFASGLSVSGMKPVVALYSTFAQRAYDQLLHDFSIQGLPLVLLLDRCGLVEGDGITHQGIFDYSLFSSIPSVNIYSPKSYNECDMLLDSLLEKDEISIVRYPKGSEKADTSPVKMEYDAEKMLYKTGLEGKRGIVITYGRLTSLAGEVVSELSSEVGLISLLKINPLDAQAISELTRDAKWVYVLEEGCKSGGVGEKLSSILKCPTEVHAIEGFVEHGDLDSLMEKCGFTREVILDRIFRLQDKN